MNELTHLVVNYVLLFLRRLQDLMEDNEDATVFATDQVLAAQLVPRTATSKICGNKWPVRNLLKDLSRSHLCFENSFDLSYKICHL